MMLMQINALEAMGFKVWFQSSLLAGMNWNNGTNCRSQSRNANNHRWNTNSNISARFLANPGIMQFLTPMEMKLAKPTPWLEPIRFENNDKKYIIFTVSGPLMEQLERYKDKMSYYAIIIQKFNYFTMS